jgi:carbon starvation protein
MNILLVIGAGAALLVLASVVYPRWIARVFDENDANPTPADRFADGKDFVRSPSHVVFAHHFASIAGAGPIVGPIIALAYGWGPAWLWIIFGGIFYGAVHDMTSMFVSVREGGRTIAEIARRTLGNTGYFLFVAFLLLVISLVNAIFLKLSAAALSSMYPLEALGLDDGQTLLRTVTKDGVVMGKIGGIATTSVIIMTLAAPVLGLLIRKKLLPGLLIFTAASLVCIISVVVGFSFPVTLSPDVWMIVLACYVALACWVPVWLLLQPRDYMNVQLLYGGMILLVAGAVVAGAQGETMQLDTSSIEVGSATRGPVWPIMFITIACGAISGFHALVATGTTVRQIPRESDCRRIGYNAMILESFLALLVLVAVGSQMDLAHYQANMQSAGGPIQTFAVGCGSLFTHLGIPMAIGCVLGILVIEGFLITTLDTAIRLARYLFEELWACLAGAQTIDEASVPTVMRNPAFNTICAVGMMLLFAYSQEAYKALWPFFGAGNQLIGALALTTVSIWLLKRGKTCWFTAIPAVFMVATAVTALGWLVLEQLRKEGEPMRYVIVGAGTVLLALAVGFVLVATLRVVQACKAVRRSDWAP